MDSFDIFSISKNKTCSNESYKIFITLYKSTEENVSKIQFLLNEYYLRKLYLIRGEVLNTHVGMMKIHIVR